MDESNLFTEWVHDEQVDVMETYRDMMLEGIYKNNFKELSKRMIDMGWDRNNNQCRQQVSN